MRSTPNSVPSPIADLPDATAKHADHELIKIVLLQFHRGILVCSWQQIRLTRASTHSQYLCASALDANCTGTNNSVLFFLSLSILFRGARDSVIQLDAYYVDDDDDVGAQADVVPHSEYYVRLYSFNGVCDEHISSTLSGTHSCSL